MAESQRKTSLENSKASIPSNEELVDSLISDFEECIVRDEESAMDEPKLAHDKKEVTGGVKTGVKVDGSESSSHNLQDNVDSVCQDEEDNEDGSIPTHEDDLVDELAMKDLELTYTEEDRQRLYKEAEVYKLNGNELFKSGQYRESIAAYTQALRTCPLAFDKERAVFYANRAAAKMKLELNKSAIEDCSKALELNEQYLKVLVRRAQLYETTDQLDEALADYKTVLEIDPLHGDALHASKRLPYQIQERNEKLKTEMLGKLKDLGNMILKPFGLSTESFQLTQDPNSGGYSVNFKS